MPLFGIVPAAYADMGFSGSWHMTSGNFASQGDEVRIWQDGDHLRGEYPLKDGRLAGHVDGDRFEGIWVQSSSNRECYEERMGSRYWGRFYLVLSEDAEHFQGRWSYCDDAHGSAGAWYGRRHHHHFHDDD
jgi:hypothetical protein